MTQQRLLRAWGPFQQTHTLIVAPISTKIPFQAVQVIGRRYRADLCLDAAAALEDRLGILTPIDPR